MKITTCSITRGEIFPDEKNELIKFFLDTKTLEKF